MSDLDRYDVEAMIRDALIGYARSSDLEAMIRDALRDYARSSELWDLECALRDEIGVERVARQDADESILRVVNSRTEHLS